MNLAEAIQRESLRQEFYAGGPGSGRKPTGSFSKHETVLDKHGYRQTHESTPRVKGAGHQQWVKGNSDKGSVVHLYGPKHSESYGTTTWRSDHPDGSGTSGSSADSLDSHLSKVYSN